jgi:hypothetical protein
MPTSVPVAEEVAHVVADVEVFDVSGKTFPRDEAVVEGELDVFQRTVVHPMDEKTKGGRVGDREVDNGVRVGGGEEMGGSSLEGGFRGRGDGRPAKEAPHEARLRAEIIDVYLE